MKPFYQANEISLTRARKLIGYVKKKLKFGAYYELEELNYGSGRSDTLYNIKLFCPVTHTDMLGNTAIKP